MNDDLVPALQKAERHHRQDQFREPVVVGQHQQTENRCFLAIVRPDNFARLAEIGMQFFALTSTKISISPGDKIVLYKSRDKAATAAGIVGTFKVTGSPYSNNQRLFVRDFSTHIPWTPITLALENPLPFAPLVPKLTFVSNKSNYGSALQGTIKRLSQFDYDLIEAALANHVNALQPDAPA